jgi:hypothetical protein
LGHVFACVALGVLCNRNNRFTILDLEHFIQTGALSVA